MTHPVFLCLQTRSIAARSTLHGVVAFAKGGPTKAPILMTSRLLSYCQMRHSRRHQISVERPSTVQTRNRGASLWTQLCGGSHVYSKPGYAVSCFLSLMLIMIAMVGYFHFELTNRHHRVTGIQNFNTTKLKQNGRHFQTSIFSAFVIFLFLYFQMFLMVQWTINQVITWFQGGASHYLN